MVEDLDYLVLHQFDLSFIHYTHPVHLASVHQAQLVHNLKHKMSNLLQVGQLLLQLVQLLLHVDQLLLQDGQLLLHIGHSVTKKSSQSSLWFTLMSIVQIECVFKRIKTGF